MKSHDCSQPGSYEQRRAVPMTGTLPDDGLPGCVLGEMVFDAAAVAAYLGVVGGGHPVHASADLARRTGLPGIPVPGPLASGAAVAVLGRRFGERVLLLRELGARFMRPIVLDQLVQVSWSLDAPAKAVGAFQEAGYTARCTLDGQADAVAVELSVRLRLGPLAGD